MSKDSIYPRIPDDQYKHFVFKLTGAYGIILRECFPMHYSDNDRMMATRGLVYGAEEFAMEVRGKPTGLYLPKEYQWRLENDIYRADD